MDRIKLGVTPTIKPRPDAVLAMEEAERKKLSNGEDKDVEMNLVHQLKYVHTSLNNNRYSLSYINIQMNYNEIIYIHFIVIYDYLHW